MKRAGEPIGGVLFKSFAGEHSEDTEETTVVIQLTEGKVPSP